ncbi:DNA-directed RNA polymerase I subunit rpa49 [Pieris rapae]|uniref:DNA-directed RNA polymerase I subunit rpa49 n=1 Tax=Pieris rapae TaxID=64459 RepID=UPI001E27A945|nr:DNA-directed RNA polymerase I subunit rpa49 [Pieris rapae]
MTTLTADVVYPKRSSYPMIVNFQNAYVTAEFNDTECSLFTNEDNEKKTILTQLGDIIYTGEEESESIGKTLLIARDRNTGKVRIIEAGHVELKPVLKNDLNASQVLETSGLELSRKFGSKKQKKQMEQRERLKMNVETVTQQVEKTIANVSVDQLDVSNYENTTESDDFYVPPINRSATSVEDVYDTKKIINGDDFEKILSEIEGKDCSEEILPSIQAIVDKNPTEMQKVYGIYASCLAKFFTATMRDINKKTYNICNSSVTLNNIIIQNFTKSINNKRGRPAEYKDKAFCHFVVLLLLMNNFKISMDTVCEVMKIAPRTVLTKVRVTGATQIKQGNKSVLHLKLPLQVKVFKRRK